MNSSEFSCSFSRKKVYILESFPGGKDFSSKPVENKKRNHEILGVFQNLEMKFILNIFPSKKKKKNFWEGNIFQEISSPDFGKSQKFHDFIFSSPVFGRNDFHLFLRKVYILELFLSLRKEKFQNVKFEIQKTLKKGVFF